MSDENEEKTEDGAGTFHVHLQDVESDVERDLLCFERRYAEGFERTSSDVFEFDFVWTDEIEVLRHMKKIRMKIRLSEEFPTKVPSIEVLEGSKDARKRIQTALRMKAAGYSKKNEKRKKKQSYLRKLFKWLDKSMLRIFNDDNDDSNEKKKKETNSISKPWGKIEHIAFEKAIRKFVVPKLRSRRTFSERERQSWWYKVAETMDTERSPEECVFHYRDMRLKMLESRLRHSNDIALKSSVERAREALNLISSALDRKLRKKESELQIKVEEKKQEEKEKEEKHEITTTRRYKKTSNRSIEDTPTLSAEAAEFVPTLTTKHHGTQISLWGVEMKAVSLVQCTRLGVQVRCQRCRNDNSISLQVGVHQGISCSKCREIVTVRFRGSAVHTSNTTLGYIDLIDNCSAVHSMHLSDFHVTCANCGELEAVCDVRPVCDSVIRFCRKCHTKLEFNSKRVKFLRTTFSNNTTTTTSNTTRINVKVEGRSKKSRRAMDAALGIRIGSALPKTGTCKHYRRSFRWFRFPCCGKAYACDKCHEEGDDKCPLDARANREICGYCSNEQPMSGAKMSKCRRCDKIIAGAPKSGHWEGGQGCRDVSKMSRKDRAKYRNSKNKTTSSSSSSSKQNSNSKKKKRK